MNEQKALVERCHTVCDHIIVASPDYVAREAAWKIKTLLGDLSALLSTPSAEAVTMTPGQVEALMYAGLLAFTKSQHTEGHRELRDHMREATLALLSALAGRAPGMGCPCWPGLNQADRSNEESRRCHKVKGGALAEFLEHANPPEHLRDTYLKVYPEEVNEIIEGVKALYTAPPAPSAGHTHIEHQCPTCGATSLYPVGSGSEVSVAPVDSRPSAEPSHEGSGESAGAAIACDRDECCVCPKCLPAAYARRAKEAHICYAVVGECAGCANYRRGFKDGQATPQPATGEAEE